MTDRKQLPFKGDGNRSKEVQVNDVLTHPMAASEKGESRDRWKYRFLRIVRQPAIDRPDGGRILVENVVTGKRTEFYALLFNVRFQ